MIVRVIYYLFLASATSLVPGCASSREVLVPHDSPYRSISSLKEGTILHVPTGVEVTKEQCFDLLAEKRIVYVGEAHTNLAHHQIELQILQAMESRHPGQVALGMEMFERSAQPILDQWLAGHLDEKSFQKEWYGNWTAEYDYYRPTLEFARDRKIPVVALNATDEQVMGLPEKGLEGLSEEIRKSIPDLDPNDPYHRKAMEAVFGGHVPSHPGGRHDKKAFERFYHTMLLWDETMAQGIADYLTGPSGKGRHMVVIAGGFHVGYGFGVPRRAFRRLPVSYAIVLPQTDEVQEGSEDLRMDVKPPRLPLYIADFIWKTGYRDLEKKQVHLGVYIEMTEKGITVREVSPGSPATRAGIKAGDVIISLGGEALKEPFDLTYLVHQKKPGDKAILKFLREDRPSEVEVTFQPPNHP